MKPFAVLVLAVAVVASGCGKSDEEKQAEDAAKRAEQSAQSAEEAAAGAARGLEEMARGLEQLASGESPSGEKVEPVRFQDLIALLPQIDGWQMEKPTGERMTSPFPTAMARATYTKDDARIEIEIVDSAFNQLLLAPMSMFLQSGYSQESTEGYEQSTTVNGQPGWEKWNIESKSGEVNALVNKRFLVTIDGDSIENPEVLQNVASKMDFNRLASLK